MVFTDSIDCRITSSQGATEEATVPQHNHTLCYTMTLPASSDQILTLCLQWACLLIIILQIQCANSSHSLFSCGSLLATLFWRKKSLTASVWHALTSSQFSATLDFKQLIHTYLVISLRTEWCVTVFSSADKCTRKRCYWNICKSAGGSQSHQDVHDHCNDLQRGMAALSAESHRHSLRQQRPSVACSVTASSDLDPVIHQLVCQPDRLWTYVETFPNVTRSGNANTIYMCDVYFANQWWHRRMKSNINDSIAIIKQDLGQVSRFCRIHSSETGWHHTTLPVPIAAIASWRCKCG